MMPPSKNFVEFMENIMQTLGKLCYYISVFPGPVPADTLQARPTSGNVTENARSMLKPVDNQRNSCMHSPNL
jgi:hypothetical protein